MNMTRDSSKNILCEGIMEKSIQILRNFIQIFTLNKQHGGIYLTHRLLDTGLPCPKYIFLLSNLLIFAALSNISFLL